MGWTWVAGRGGAGGLFNSFLLRSFEGQELFQFLATRYCCASPPSAEAPAVVPTSFSPDGTPDPFDDAAVPSDPGPPPGSLEAADAGTGAAVCARNAHAVISLLRIVQVDVACVSCFAQ